MGIGGRVGVGVPVSCVLTETPFAFFFSNAQQKPLENSPNTCQTETSPPATTQEPSSPPLRAPTCVHTEPTYRCWHGDSPPHTDRCQSAQFPGWQTRQHPDAHNGGQGPQTQVHAASIHRTGSRSPDPQCGAGVQLAVAVGVVATGADGQPHVCVATRPRQPLQVHQLGRKIVGVAAAAQGHACNPVVCRRHRGTQPLRKWLHLAALSLDRAWVRTRDSPGFEQRTENRGGGVRGRGEQREEETENGAAN